MDASDVLSVSVKRPREVPMGFVDRQGRLFGKVSVIDLVAVLFVVLLTPCVYYGSRLIAGHQRPEIFDINPDRVRAGVPSEVRIEGRKFNGWTKVEIGGLPCSQVRFVGPGLLTVQVPADITVGWHDVRVRDHRNRVAVLERALEVLEPPPRMTVQVHVLCLWTELTKDAVKWLEAQRTWPDAHQSMTPQIEYVYGSSFQGKWVLAQMRLTGELNRAYDPPIFFYQGQEVGTGRQIQLTIGRLPLKGFVVSEPSVSRVLGAWQP